jgi:flagellar basal body-associated protein FliL
MDEKEKKISADAPEVPEVKIKVKKSGPSKIIFYGIIAGAVIFNVIVATVLINITRPKDVAEIEAKAKSDSLKANEERGTEIGGVSDPIEAVVNIAGTNGERFLKVVIRFEYDDKKYPKIVEEFKRRAPKFKDMLIDRLSQMTLTEINESETKTRIRQDILRVANNSFRPEDGELRDVFIDQFIIQ